MKGPWVLAALWVGWLTSLAFGVGLASGQSYGHPSAPEPRLTVSREEFLRSNLVTSSKEDEATMGELSARLAWVQDGRRLPKDARRRTVLRANSIKPDFVGPYGFREDVSVTKRNLSLGILSLNDKLPAEPDVTEEP